MKSFMNLALGATVFVASTAHAADHLVTTGQSIQTAITAAANGDRVLVEPGIYAEAIDTLGKSIEIVGVWGPGSTTIDATGLNTSVLTLRGAQSQPIVRGFTFTGGTGSTHPDGTFGGGGVIDVDGTAALISNCLVRSNHVANGGAACGGGALGRIVGNGISFFGSPRFVDCEFRGNSADDGGGGVAGELRLTRCILESNTAVRGGGAFSPTTATIERSIVRANTAAHGGGVYSRGGSLSGTSIVDNVATTEVGGLLVENLSLGGGALLAELRIVGNSAPVRGGLSMSSAATLFAQMRLSSSVVANNTSTGGGPTIDLSGAGTTMAFEYVTLVGENILSNTGQATSAVNSILRQTTWTHHGPFQHSITFSNVQGGSPGVGNFDADPQFIDAANRNYHLKLTSPCIAKAITLPSGSHTLDVDGTDFSTAPSRAVGADQLLPSLEFAGDVAPGGTLTLRAHAAPNGPVLVFLSLTQLENGIPVSPGTFRLGLPLLFGTPVLLGNASNSGVLSASGIVPSDSPIGLPIHAQALWSTFKLSNTTWTQVH